VTFEREIVMRVLAIGDIHGHVAELGALLEFVGPTGEDLVITLGDYVDGGPDSPGVLDWLLAMAETRRLVAIRGNHDQMMLSARADETMREMWLALGGRSTMAAYPGESIECVPEEHWWFLRTYCVDWHETGTHLFVHAHVEPDVPMERQTKQTLHWQTVGAGRSRAHGSGKVVVCGHTSQESGMPLDLGHTVCLDTLGGGWLTCLDVGARRGWQVRKGGRDRREFEL
jgi:serine/threonine protein phosphatase 1